MLNFVNAEIDSVIRAIGQISGKNFLIDPRVKGTINIASVKPVSPRLAYEILVSSLRMQGFAAVESDGVVKILPEADAKQHGSRTFGPRISTGGDQVVTQVYPLQHATAVQMVAVLRPLIAPNNAITAYPAGNTLVITDYADNLKRISNIIETMDRPNDAEFNVLPLKHQSAIELAQQLSRLFIDPGGQPQQPGGPSLLIAADARTNSLLVRSDNPGKLNNLRALVAQLDQPSNNQGTLRVVHLRNASAEKLAETLRAVATGEQKAKAATGGQAGTQAALSSEATTILADPATNSLVINAPETLYNSLRAVIDQLDSQRAQIFVEALIVEITSDKAAEMGIQWQGPILQQRDNFLLAGGTNFGQGGDNLLGLSASLATGSPSSLPGKGLNLVLGQELTVNGKKVTALTGLARLLESDADANILSTPNLLTLDNEEAKIVIGQNVPFVTGSYAQAASAGTTATVNPFQTIERKDVGLTLKVKPQISEGGNIKLQIMQEVSSVRDSTSGAADIVTSKRSIETTVIIRDGEAIVLGGLIEDGLNQSQDKVPVLGDLPILGGLFRSEERTRVKTNLMVFLRPQVVRTPEEVASLTQGRYEYIRNAQAAFPVRSSLVLPDTRPASLPDLKMDKVLAPVVPPRQEKPVPAAPSSSAAATPTESEFWWW